MKDRKNYFIKKLAILLGSLLFSFSIAEAICRLTNVDKRPLFRQSEIPGLIYEYIPGSEGRTRGNPVKINSFGLREYEFPSEKLQGTFRILALGDSFTYGEGVALEETYLKKLEHMLNKAGLSRYYQSINAGVPGYSICQQKTYLEERGIRFKPDLVIVGFLLGNPCKVSLRPPAYGQEKGIKGVVLETLLFLREHSYLFNFLTERIYTFWQMRYLESIGEVQKIRVPLKPVHLKSSPKLAGSQAEQDSLALIRQEQQSQLPVRPVTPKSPPGLQSNIRKFPVSSSLHIRNKYTLFHHLYNPKGEYWPKCKKALAGIAHLCQGMNFPVILVIWPDLHELDDNHPYLDLYQQAAETGREYGMEALELFPIFKGKKAEELWVSSNDFHPNARAHQLAAEEIYNFIISKNIINAKRF